MPEAFSCGVCDWIALPHLVFNRFTIPDVLPIFKKRHAEKVADSSSGLKTMFFVKPYSPPEWLGCVERDH
jgi:hypothetical protein